MSAARLILASASPRRAEILRTLGIPFEARPTGADEDAVPPTEHASFVRAVAALKLHRALSVIDEEDMFVLAADTIVCVDEERLGKPTDERDALRMLELLNGRDHIVRTAIALGRSRVGELALEVTESRVWFRRVSGDTLQRYAETGEGVDKAGAYAVQGTGCGLVDRLEGSYTNVVGLPAAQVVDLLIEHGALDRWP